MLHTDNNVTQNNQYVDIHATIADAGLWPNINSKGQVKGQLSVQLFYLCRALDPRGSGAAVIDLAAAAKILGTSIYSIRRRLTWGLRLGLFRAKLRAGVGKVKIFYRSIENICVHLNIADIGAVTRIDITCLSNIKFAATEAAALRLQKQSRWRETHRKKCDRKKTLDPEQMTTSDLRLGAILSKYGRLTFLKRSNAAYGGSQKRLAYELGRHRSTIQRRLSDGYRVKHNLEPIAKTQLAVTPEYYTLHTSSSKPPIRKLKPNQRLIKIPGLGIFRIACNVYALPDNLKSKRMLRIKVKRAMQRAADREAFSNDWKLQPEYQALKQAWKAANDKSELCSEKIWPPRSSQEYQ